MKLSTLMIIGMLGVIAYVLLDDSLRTRGKEEQAAAIERNRAAMRTKELEEGSAQSPVVRYAAARPTVSADQLAIARGKISGFTKDGMIVDCDQPMPGSSWRAPSGAGAADIARMAQISSQQEAKDYGPLMMAEGGRLTGSRITPSQKVGGVVFVAGHPNENQLTDGSRVNVLVATLGQPYTAEGRRMNAYTMQFSVAGGISNSDAGRSWMFQETKMQRAYK